MPSCSCSDSSSRNAATTACSAKGEGFEPSVEGLRPQRFSSLSRCCRNASRRAKSRTRGKAVSPTSSTCASTRRGSPSLPVARRCLLARGTARRSPSAPRSSPSATSSSSSASRPSARPEGTRRTPSRFWGQAPDARREPNRRAVRRRDAARRPCSARAEAGAADAALDMTGRHEASAGPSASRPPTATPPRARRAGTASRAGARAARPPRARARRSPPSPAR